MEQSRELYEGPSYNGHLIYNKGYITNQWGKKVKLGKLVHYMEKNKAACQPTSPIRSNSRGVKEPTVKVKLYEMKCRMNSVTHKASKAQTPFTH